jgi:hypothetical protein
MALLDKEQIATTTEVKTSLISIITTLVNIIKNDVANS